MSEEKKPLYKARITYKHVEQFGNINRMRVLEYPKERPVLTGDEAMKMVAQHLGYLDSKFKPTELAARLRIGRNDHIEIMERKVIYLPGPILSSDDVRFQELIDPAESDEGQTGTPVEG